MTRFLKIVVLLLVTVLTVWDIFFPRHINNIYFVQANNGHLMVPVDGQVFIYDVLAMSQIKHKK